MTDKKESKEDLERLGLERLGEEVFKNTLQANLVNEMKANTKSYIEHIFLLVTLKKAKYDYLCRVFEDKELAKEILLNTKLFE